MCVSAQTIGIHPVISQVAWYETLRRPASTFVVGWDKTRIDYLSDAPSIRCPAKISGERGSVRFLGTGQVEVVELISSPYMKPSPVAFGMSGAVIKKAAL